MRLPIASIIPLLTLLTIVASAQIRDYKASTRIIPLKGYIDAFTVAFEYDSAIVSFSLTDVRAQLTKVKAKKKYQGKDLQEFLSESLNDVSTDKDYLFRGNYRDPTGGIIEQYIFRTLISKGKSKVLDKRASMHVEKIKRTHYVSHKGGEKHEGYEYAFVNGTRFFTEVISI